MHHAAAMGVAQRASHLAQYGLRHGEGQPAQIRDHGSQRSPLHELHDEVEEVLGLPHGVDGDDVRVAQRRRGTCLALEALGHPLVVPEQSGRDDLDGDPAVQREVVCQVHDGHSAPPHLAEHLVFAQRRLAQPLHEEIGVARPPDRGRTRRRYRVQPRPAVDAVHGTRTVLVAAAGAGGHECLRGSGGGSMVSRWAWMGVSAWTACTRPPWRWLSSTRLRSRA